MILKQECSNCEYFEPDRTYYGHGYCFINSLLDDRPESKAMKDTCEFWIERSEDE